MPYYICEFCKQPIKVHKFDRHVKEAHPNEIPKKTDLKRLRKILSKSKSLDTSGGSDPLSLWFEVAKRVFSEIEGVDTSDYGYIYDYQAKEFLKETIPTTRPPYPPIMLHVKGVIKNQKMYEESLKKYRGTRMEIFLKEIIKGIPVVIVYKENYANYVREWLKEGMTKSDIMLLTVFFYLHEMYHIIGYGERDADIKAADSILEIFGIRVGIPDYEIKRWEEYDRFKTKYEERS